MNQSADPKIKALKAIEYSYNQHQQQQKDDNG